jgi:2-oxoglutarate dehydrogenase complex dehydrogenase (E1) component-like enzyme
MLCAPRRHYGMKPGSAKRVVICGGKVYYELVEAAAAKHLDDGAGDGNST